MIAEPIPATVRPDHYTTAPQPDPEPGIAGHAVERLHFLDGLRAIAALLVLLFHAGYLAIPIFQPLALQFFDIGYCGVVLFFLCSGFIIPPTIRRQGSVGRFLVRRVLRLYPLYLAALAFYLIATAFGMTFYQPGTWASLAGRRVPAVLINMTMFQGVFDVPNIVPNAWTLELEWFFYGLVVVLFASKLLARPIAATCLVLIPTIILKLVAPLVLNRTYDPWGICVPLAIMSLGMLAERVVTGTVSRQWGTRLLVVGALALLLIWDMTPGRILARAVALALFGLALLQRRRPVAGWLLFLGRISYSLYLVHIAVIIRSRRSFPRPSRFSSGSRERSPWRC